MSWYVRFWPIADPPRTASAGCDESGHSCRSGLPGPSPRRSHRLRAARAAAAHRGGAEVSIRTRQRNKSDDADDLTLRASRITLPANVRGNFAVQLRLAVLFAVATWFVPAGAETPADRWNLSEI